MVKRAILVQKGISKSNDGEGYMVWPVFAELSTAYGKKDGSVAVGRPKVNQILIFGAFNSLRHSKQYEVLEKIYEGAIFDLEFTVNNQNKAVVSNLTLVLDPKVDPKVLYRTDEALKKLEEMKANAENKETKTVVVEDPFLTLLNAGLKKQEEKTEDNKTLTAEEVKAAVDPNDNPFA